MYEDKRFKCTKCGAGASLTGPVNAWYVRCKRGKKHNWKEIENES